jgi:hypothetical protein
MLAVGLLTEAFIFALSAFEPVDNELDWSLLPRVSYCVSSETKGGSCVRFARNVIPKIRCYVKDAKIDGELMSSLGNSIF